MNDTIMKFSKLICSEFHIRLAGDFDFPVGFNRSPAVIPITAKWYRRGIAVEKSYTFMSSPIVSLEISYTISESDLSLDLIAEQINH